MKFLCAFLALAMLSACGSDSGPRGAPPAQDDPVSPDPQIVPEEG